jgi:hypothetical protein
VAFVVVVGDMEEKGPKECADQVQQLVEGLEEEDLVGAVVGNVYPYSRQAMEGRYGRRGFDGSYEYRSALAVKKATKENKV